LLARATACAEVQKLGEDQKAVAGLLEVAGDVGNGGDRVGAIGLGKASVSFPSWRRVTPPGRTSRGMRRWVLSWGGRFQSHAIIDHPTHRKPSSAAVETSAMLRAMATSAHVTAAYGAEEDQDVGSLILLGHSGILLIARKTRYNSRMLELQSDMLVVFVSDSHIGGDPGCDGFESPAELEALFEELRAREGPVELILAGDFFDFLQIGKAPQGKDRASLTTERPEYRDLFASLRRFRGAEGKRVIYLPGNHDAESFWNPAVQETLKERGLVDEFAYYYLASVETGGEPRVIYCEHGNQLDPANTVEDYHDPLDTPLGHHVVMDFTRRVAPLGVISGGLDLSEIKMVYPLVAIPHWIASRYFYDFVGKVVSYLLLPLLVAYAVYRVAVYFLTLASGSDGLFGDYRALPRVHGLFIDVVLFGLVILLIFGVFFLVIRHAIRRTLATVSPGGRPRYSPAEASQNAIRSILIGDAGPPMDADLDPKTVDVFVSGHTHLPSLVEVEEPSGRRAVMVNSGCFLRQLQPVSPHLKGPPVFVSKFVLTHVRVFTEGGQLRAELREQPKTARQRLSRIERLLSWGRRPPQPPPDAKPRVVGSAAV
jgi:UDP-2,3-diacylglucosamine pyrophosphatase LpxH